MRIEHLTTDGLLRRFLRDHSSEGLLRGRGQEPRRHHRGDHRRRRELGHRGQANRRQAQLARRVQQVEQHEEDERHAGALVGVLGAPHQDEEARADLNQTERELGGIADVELVFVHPAPKHGEDGRQQEDETGVEALRLT